MLKATLLIVSFNYVNSSIHWWPMLMACRLLLQSHLALLQSHLALLPLLRMLSGWPQMVLRMMIALLGLGTMMMAVPPGLTTIIVGMLAMPPGMIIVGMLQVPPGMKVGNGLLAVVVVMFGLGGVATMTMQATKIDASNSLDLSDLLNGFVEDTTVEGEVSTWTTTIVSFLAEKDCGWFAWCGLW